jgi:hypothetical protein
MAESTMTLRKKTLIIIGLTLVGLIVLLLVAARYFADMRT